MKTIIKRNLPLDVKYQLIDRKYIPVLDGGGSCCDNCGKLIANIATVKSENGTYNIGFDCLETFLLNNSLLDGFDLDKHETVKKQINQIIRFSKNLKKTFSENKNLNITGLKFEAPLFSSDWITFYYLLDGNTSSRNNDNVKLKGMDFKLFIETIRNIFPNMDILID